MWRRRAIDGIGEFLSPGSNFPNGGGETPDASLSTVDGIAGVKASASCWSTTRSPLLIMTAELLTRLGYEPVLAQAAVDAGAREVLRKPVQSRELAAALARALAA